MISRIERHWYRRSLTWLTALLLPLSLLFRLIVKIRVFLYRHQWIQSVNFPVPVIVVGNITVGGTGKTPLVIHLATLLKAQQWRPGIVTRGMGGKKHQKPLWVDKNADPSVVGDEALLLVRHTDCPVVIGIDRVAAVQTLLSQTDCTVVISDDGLQHYRLGRAIEIAVIDGHRQLGNGHLLPAGPLRESRDRLNQVDYVIQQSGERAHDYFSMELEGNELVSLMNPDTRLSLADFKNKKVHAVSGIGNPERFFATLRRQGFDITEHVFPDHYLYQKEDFNFSDKLPIVMTEKDRVKCEKFADERFWYLPVIAKLDQPFETELLALLNQKESICKSSNLFS